MQITSFWSIEFHCEGEFEGVPSLLQSEQKIPVRDIQRAYAESIGVVCADIFGHELFDFVRYGMVVL